MNWLSISGKASNLNRLSRTRSTSPSAQFSIRAILSRVYVQLDARPIEKGYREIVYSWKSSGLESAEQCERKSIKSHPRSNSVFAQFSVVCIFNWMLGQLRKDCGKVVYSWKSSELESAEQCTPHPQPNSVFAQFSAVCMFNWMLGQLRRVVGRSYVRGRAPNLNRLSSEGKCHKPSLSAQFSVRAILSRVYVQLDARPIKEGCGKIVCSWKQGSQ